MNWLLYTARRYNDPLHLGLWYAYQGPEIRHRPYGDGNPWLEERSLDTKPFSHDLTMPYVQTLLFWDADAPYTPIERSDRPTAVYSPGTEHVNIRTSWNHGAVYVNLAGAGRNAASQTHRHADSGHFLFVTIGGDDGYLVVFDTINRDDQYRSYWWQMQGNPDGAFDHGCVDAPGVRALSRVAFVRRDEVGEVQDAWAADQAPIQAI